MVKQRSDNEIYLLIKYIKSVLWRVAKRLSYIWDARCLKVKGQLKPFILVSSLGCVPHFVILLDHIALIILAKSTNLDTPHHALSASSLGPDIFLSIVL